MFGIPNLFQYVSVILLVALIATSLFLNNKIDNLENNIKDIQLLLAQSQVKATTYKSALEKQNIYIENMKINLKKKNDELSEWKAKPEKIRYNVIYKTIPADTNLTRGNCDDTENVIDAIRTINLNDL